MFESEEEALPPEPGTVSDPTLGFSDLDAGSPDPEPPVDDQELGDEEMAVGDGDDLEDEED